MDSLDLANKSADVAGSIVGAGVGLAVAGPTGAIGGAAIGPLITNAFKDVAARLLSPRERIRLDNAIEYITAGIEENMLAHKIVRQDDFFVGDTNFSGNGTELLEGVLLKCKAEYQSKKVRLIANIFKNVAFDDTVSAEIAYHVLSLAEQLTYHELCLLSFFGRKGDFTNFQPYNYSLTDYQSTVLKNSPGAWERMQDLMSMYRQALIKDGSGSSHIMVDTLKPHSLELHRRGRTLFDLLDLAQIPKEDVMAIVKPLGEGLSNG
jgi:hypothetical protein